MTNENTFDLVERCARLGAATDAASLRELLGLLSHADWHVRFAAAVATGDRRSPEAVPALLELLRAEEAAPLFTQPRDMCGLPAGCNDRLTVQLPAGTTDATREAWRRRGRVLQAACLALGQIGTAARPALPYLQRYATDQKVDYAVRAASCKALGLIGDAAALESLARAKDDGEWCTATEARKAFHVLTAKHV